MVKCPKEFLNFDTFDDNWKDYVEMEHDIIDVFGFIRQRLSHHGWIQNTRFQSINSNSKLPYIKVQILERWFPHVLV